MKEGGAGCSAGLSGRGRRLKPAFQAVVAGEEGDVIHSAGSVGPRVSAGGRRYKPLSRRGGLGDGVPGRLGCTGGRRSEVVPVGTRENPGAGWPRGSGWILE